ncbi:MAG: universal stress protein [Chloroflexota bacterium]|jgi:nucleotide-binding universal stress UspA family protein
MMFNSVLVPLDGSALAEGILPHALTISQAFETKVTFAHVLEPLNATAEARVDPLTWQMLKAEGQNYLQQLSARWSEVTQPAETELLEGAAAERIISFAAKNDCDLIMLSSHGRSGLSDWNISSIVQKVIMRIFRSVLIVRASASKPQDSLQPIEYKRILVPLDGSRRAEGVLPIFPKLIKEDGAEIILAHIVSSPVGFRQPPSPADASFIDDFTRRNEQEAREYLEQICDRLCPHASYKVLVSESPPSSLLELAEETNADLVIFSAHGRTAANHPYGSMVTEFINYGHAPLLIYQDLPEEQLRLSVAETNVDLAQGRRGRVLASVPLE